MICIINKDYVGIICYIAIVSVSVIFLQRIGNLSKSGEFIFRQISDLIFK